MQSHIFFDPQEQVLLLLDQRRLPGAEEIFRCGSCADVIRAMREMVVRGAPAIGVVAAWGCVLAAKELTGDAARRGNWEERLEAMLGELRKARPTAVNLAWAVERLRGLWRREKADSLEALLALWKDEAARMQKDDIAVNKRIGAHGAALLDHGDRVLTHCNAGALATAGYGTALGVIYAAHEQGKKIRVIADETRPLLQGARLTAYELRARGVPVTVVCDSACALLMRRGMVQKVLVGADRIAANGDVANKIGTYGVALIAKAHGVPFYVAAPLSTVDPATPAGDDIPLEERPAAEVTHLAGGALTPEGVPALNFAFDVTPAELVSALVTEKGVLEPPYGDSIARALAKGE